MHHKWSLVNFIYMKKIHYCGRSYNVIRKCMLIPEINGGGKGHEVVLPGICGSCGYAKKKNVMSNTDDIPVKIA